MKNLHNYINLKGNREQSFKFAFGWKGGMKQCQTKGCDISTPLFFNTKGIDLSGAMILEKLHNKEYSTNENGEKVMF